MREIVSRQDEELAKDLSARGELLDVLALAATGNPRVFLTTLSDSMPLNQQNCERVLKKYYSQDIWHQHNNLAEQYPGHRPLIEWGSSFMHDYVFPALKRGHYRDDKHGGLRDIWIHRDAPQPVQEAMQFLCYSGVLQEGSRAVKRHGALGTRYVVNLGCQFTQAANIVKYASGVRNDLSGRDVIEFGRDHDSYDTLDFQTDAAVADGNAVLDARLRAPTSVLPLSKFQRSVIEGLKFKTVGDVLKAEESVFKRAKGVADVRARQIHNAAQQAVMEYLSG
ncbi:hypothetical protein AB0G04_09795 [Actinoplanes sp. NPDC023801]|uniref:hypothetical protein n=1 Tax=Actinoplanes sp. NPDC023801 TaxID=3154595 RepID=UPI0033F01DF7